MARTFGGAGTDSITLALTSHSNLRSYSMWAYWTGAGGGNNGRMFDKRTASAQVELMYYNASNWWAYSRAWTAGGEWSCPSPSTSTWHNIVVTYDGNSTSNDAVIYIDGVSQTITERSTPSGSIVSTADAFVLGNRTNDNARNWGGRLCEFAAWDRILTADEAKALGKGFSPLHLPNSLIEYVDLVRDIRSRKLAAPTSSGTVVVEHPPIIYPF